MQNRSLVHSQFLACLAACLGAFLLVANLCSLAFDRLEKVFPPREMLLAKIEWLAAHPELYDAVFLGSSFIQCNVAGSQFDAEMSKRGYPTRSFSLSGPGMGQFESLMALRFLRKKSAIHPKYVFIEPSLFSQDFKNKTTERRRRLNTFRSAWDDCILNLRSDRSPQDKIIRAATQIELSLANITNVGRFASLQERISTNNQIQADALGKDKDGFQPILFENREKMPRTFLKKELRVFENSLKKMRLYEEERDPQSVAKETETVRLIIREIRTMGAEPIILITPGIFKYHFPLKAITAPSNPEKVAAFDFLKPDAYPSLYTYECYNSPISNHLRQACAEDFSRLLGTEFADYLKKREPPVSS